MKNTHDSDNNFIVVKTTFGIVKQRKFNTNDIRTGLKYTAKLSLQLNDLKEMKNLFQSLFNSRPYHHIEYLKSKLGNAASHHNDKISAALYLSHNRIPISDKAIFIKYLCDNLNIMTGINMAIWFVKWSFSNFGISWMSECLDLDGDELRNEWFNYCKLGLDTYFLQTSEEKLQKYVNAVNLLREKCPDVGEIQDSLMEVEWNN